MTTNLLESRPYGCADLPTWYESVLDEHEGSGLGVAEFAARIVHARDRSGYQMLRYLGMRDCDRRTRSHFEKYGSVPFVRKWDLGRAG